MRSTSAEVGPAVNGDTSTVLNVKTNSRTKTNSSTNIVSKLTLLTGNNYNMKRFDLCSGKNVKK